MLAILIELGQQDNLALQHIVQQLEQVMIEGEETNLLSPIPIGDLLPHNTADFYRYQGSLVNLFTNAVSSIKTKRVSLRFISIDNSRLSRDRILDHIQHAHFHFRSPSIKKLKSPKWLKFSFYCLFKIVATVSSAL